MSSLEEIFEKACVAREIPGAVLIAKDRSGNFSYSKAFGKRSLKNSTKGLNDGEDPPMTLDTVMWIASCTKLLTATAALQCVERGLLTLDDDITGIWGPLKGIEILKGWGEDGKPILEKPKEVLTLRHLLCHTSGFGYDALEPDLMKWRQYNNEFINDGFNFNGPRVQDRYLLPLLFEPGSSWMYGGGMDILGKIIEAVNPPNTTLQSFFQENIFKPLGIKDMAFFLNDRPDMLQRFADLTFRDPGSETVRDSSELSFNVPVEDACGGGGLFATAEEYMKVLESLLKDDGKLLKSSTAELLFTPQWAEDSAPLKAMEKKLSDPAANFGLGGGTPFKAKRNWGLGGILMMEDAEGGELRGKGTLSWSGMPNLNWFIDRKKGLSGIFATQIFPPGEEKSYQMFQVFERAMYERSKQVN